VSAAAQRAQLHGGRWHFQHGPIDILIDAKGDASALRCAHAAAWARFETVLSELVAELPLLRRPLSHEACPLAGELARQMWAACAPLVAEADGYITPMAAVAGAVAQALIGSYRRAGIARAWVNNGGDIALHLSAGTQARVGLYADLAAFDAQAAERSLAGDLRTDAGFMVYASDPVRGVATSGWRGRSHSRGIADSVTVLAGSAAMADAAATVIANAVDADAPGIVRRPADSLRDDSDLGAIAVTVAVPTLPDDVVQGALQRGLDCARRLQRRGLVHAALLVCQGSLARLQPAQALESALVQ
jgi:ApbE superfamily uncharacterized protein (UPF0280 family)